MFLCPTCDDPLLLLRDHETDPKTEIPQDEQAGIYPMWAAVQDRPQLGLQRPNPYPTNSGFPLATEKVRRPTTLPFVTRCPLVTGPFVFAVPLVMVRSDWVRASLSRGAPCRHLHHSRLVSRPTPTSPLLRGLSPKVGAVETSRAASDDRARSQPTATFSRELRYRPSPRPENLNFHRSVLL